MIRSAVSLGARHYGTQVDRSAPFAPRVGWRAVAGEAITAALRARAGPGHPGRRAQLARGRRGPHRAAAAPGARPGRHRGRPLRRRARAEADAADARIAAAGRRRGAAALPGRALHDQGVDRVRGHAQHRRRGGPQGHAGPAVGAHHTARCWTWARSRWG